jgi:hypothetical protein
MEPPRRKLARRALLLVVLFFAVDFVGIASVMHGEAPFRDDPIQELLAPILVLGSFLLILALIPLYAPRMFAVVLAVILMVMVLGLFSVVCLSIVPVLRHS